MVEVVIAEEFAYRARGRDGESEIVFILVGCSARFSRCESTFYDHPGGDLVPRRLWERSGGYLIVTGIRSSPP
jgi:hypothetical protein